MPFTQYRAEWSTPLGGSGYSILNSQASSAGPAQQFANQVGVFFTAIASNIPQGVTISFPEEATFHSDNGTILEYFPIDPPETVVPAFPGDYAGPAGLHIQWRTGTVVGGRRLLGRTFIVPLLASAFDPDGTLNPAIIAQVQDAAEDLVTTSTSAAAALSVWSRTASLVAPVTSVVVPDQATVLRSRRD
jgi:hypothetical protein